MLEAYFIGSFSKHVLSAAHFIVSAKCSQCALSAVKVPPSLEAGATCVTLFEFELFIAVNKKYGFICSK